MSTLKVDGIRSNSASSDAITLAGDGTCTAKITNRTNRNLIINGAMRVAQRGTSSTTSGYGDLDRWKHEYGTVDENPTFAQVAVSSGDSGDNPFAKGITKCLKITNGNQTSGLQANSQINLNQNIEAQNIRNSGWNYTSSSSYITLSYYVKASVAQEYHGFVKTVDGSNYVYPYSLGSLSANTWTKITKTIPGNSNLQIDDDANSGFQIFPIALYGTSYTNNSITEDTWAAWASGNRSHDQTSTWWTTNDSTFEITGVQLEVGSVATDFEHEDHNTTLRKCQRYCWRFGMVDNAFIFGGIMGSTTNARMLAKFPVPMRANPTITINALKVDGEVSGSVETVNSVSGTNFNSDFGGRIVLACDASTVDTGGSVMLYTQSSSGYIQGDSEL